MGLSGKRCCIFLFFQPAETSERQLPLPIILCAVLAHTDLESAAKVTDTARGEGRLGDNVCEIAAVPVSFKCDACKRF